MATLFRSLSQEHFEQDLDLFDFSLTDTEMQQLNNLGSRQYVVVHG